MLQEQAADTGRYGPKVPPLDQDGDYDCNNAPDPKDDLVPEQAVLRSSASDSPVGGDDVDGPKQLVRQEDKQWGDLLKALEWGPADDGNLVKGGWRFES